MANTAPRITLADNNPALVGVHGVYHHIHTENQTHVLRVTADDADGDDLNYSIYGWYYMDLFEIRATTGDLSFKTTPDYETPTDNHQAGVYGIMLRGAMEWLTKTKPFTYWSKTKTKPQPQSNQASPWRFPRTKPMDSLSGPFRPPILMLTPPSPSHWSMESDRRSTHFFSLDENGTLSSAVIFDDENNRIIPVRHR